MKKLLPFLFFLLFITKINAQQAHLDFVSKYKFALDDKINALQYVKCVAMSTGKYAFYSQSQDIEIFSQSGLKSLYTIKKPIDLITIENIGDETFAITVKNETMTNGDIIISKQKLGNQQWGENIEIGKINVGIMNRRMISPFNLGSALGGVNESSILRILTNEEGSKWIGYSASYGENNTNEKFKLIYFDSELSKIEHQSDVELKYIEDKFQINEMLVTKEGKVIIVGDEYIDKRKRVIKDKPGFKTHVIIINEKGIIESDQIIAHEDYFFHPKITNKDNVFYLEGLLAEAENIHNMISVPVGFISVAIKAESNYIAEKKVITFSNELVSKLKQNRKNEGLTFNCSHFNNDNKLITISNACAGVNGFYAGPLMHSYSLLVNRDGKIIKEYAISKPISYDVRSNSTEYFITDYGYGLAQFEIGNIVYILFNDDIENTTLNSENAKKFKGKQKDSGIKLITISENGETSVKFIYNYADSNDDILMCLSNVFYKKDNKIILSYLQKVSVLSSSQQPYGGVVGITLTK